MIDTSQFPGLPLVTGGVAFHVECLPVAWDVASRNRA